MTPLNLKLGLGREDVYRKGRFQQGVTLPPLHFGRKIQARAGTGERDELSDGALLGGVDKLQSRHQRTTFHHFRRALKFSSRPSGHNDQFLYSSVLCAMLTPSLAT
jgi:hypothetical protein